MAHPCRPLQRIHIVNYVTTRLTIRSLCSDFIQQGCHEQRLSELSENVAIVALAKMTPDLQINVLADGVSRSID